MAKLYASPTGGRHLYDGADRATATFQQAIDQAQPGDEILLLPGVYDVPVAIRGKQAGENPIVVRGDTRATLDGRRSVLRPPNAINASDTAAGGIEIFSMIQIAGSAGIILKNLAIQGAWPVAIHINQSSRIAIQGVSFNGSTIAILAWGKSTSELLVEDCRWTQDERIYQGILWDDIHGGVKPRKELDGDFFRSFDIAGTCVFRSNYIANAFNGIQFFALERSTPGSVNKNVWIYRNTFSLIRDNAIEAEYSAYNWWVHENAIFNCHKWFAFEKCNGGHWYLFSNRGWFDRRQGPPGDCASGGAVIKASKVKKEKEDLYLPKDPVYLFHNSWYLRSAYMKDGKLRKFNHFNNAIEFADAARHAPGTVDPLRRMIGPGAADPLCDDPFEAPETFTTEWPRLNIVFRNDYCNHQTFPERLREAGYPVEGVHTLPGFESGRGGDFAPREKSPLLGKSIAWEIELPGRKDTWKLPAGRNVGAMGPNPNPAAKAKFIPMSPKSLGLLESAWPGAFFTAAWLKALVEDDRQPSA